VILDPDPAHTLVSFIIESCRGVAQPGSAPALGAGGPRFKSARPDQTSVEVFAAVRLQSLSGNQRWLPMADFSFKCGSALGGKVVERFVKERRPECFTANDPVVSGVVQVAAQSQSHEG
jgi:hypothetical protein